MSRTVPFARRTSALAQFLFKNSRPAAVAALLTCCTGASWAAVPNRLRADAALNDRAELPQQVSQRVATATSLGHVSGDTAMPTMSLVLAPTAAQSAALDKLLAAQQDPTSPSYHKWLTPAQFGSQFGVSDNDVQVMENWLTSQGFQVLGVAPSHNQIQFSGTAGLVESAFGTAMTRLRRSDQEFFENSSTLKVPAAFQGIIAGISGLSSYRMQAHDLRSRMRPQTNNSSQTNPHSLSPWDVRQIYDANALVNSGYSGNGVKIGIIGQSAVDTTQLADFQTLTGQTVKAPTLVLVPGSGASTAYQGDEGESEADLEFAGGVAPGASLYFIYSGSSTNADVITALEYAITNNTAQILSLSYGGCEVSYAAASVNIEPFFRQAGAQGQTIVVASGDSGAAGCDTSGGAAQDGLQVSYPASSPSVTAVGGTTLNDTSGNTYWNTSNNSQLGSALGYIPETAWNDTSVTTTATTLLSTGGGKSSLFSKPNWQTGIGVPADNARDIPDISFSGSNRHDTYLWCTADGSVAQTTTGGSTITGACTTSTFGSYQVGGTSLSTPSFAGMLAIAESANGGGALGNINPVLYSLSDSSTGVFHDITSGNNMVPCVSGTLNCSAASQLGYSTATGFDPVTGLGSMDMGIFSTKLSSVKTTAARAPTVILQTSSTTGTSTIFTAIVSATNSVTQPTGSISFAVDGGTATQQTLMAGASAAGSNFTVNTGSLAAGTHTLTATYAGDSNYGAASTSLTFTSGTSTGNFSVITNPGTLTVVAGQTGQVALNFTSNSGFNGLLTYTIGIVSGPTQRAGCFTGRNDLSLASGGTAAVSLVYHSLTRECTTLGNAVTLTANMKSTTASAHPAGLRNQGSSGAPIYALLVGGGLLGSCAVRRRKLWSSGLLAVAFSVAAAGLSGCGSGSTALPATATTTSAQPGTYNLLVTATSVSNSSLTATTNLTLVIQ